MELLPAIDLRGGTAVRLTQGDFDREVRYGDPAELAARYIAAGARWVHVVDLDAARTGVPHERAVLDEIVRLAVDASVCVEAGGGVRTEDDAGGAARVRRGAGGAGHGGARGSRAGEPLCASLARRVAVGLDYRVGPDGVAEAQTQGWLAGLGPRRHRPPRAWEGEPIGAVVATSVARDGMLSGPDLAGLRALLAATSLPVVASGGVSGAEDLVALARLGASDRALAGAIVGKAIVEGRLTVEEGLAVCAVSA